MTDLDDEQLLTALWRAYAGRLPDGIRATRRDLLDAILADHEQPRAEQILPPAPPRIVPLDAVRAEVHQARTEDRAPALGWPWCGDPGASRPTGEAIATQHLDGSITLAWEPQDARSTIVSRDVLDAVVDERNRLVRELADTRAILDGSGAEVERLRGLLVEALSPGLLADRWVEIRREAGLT